MEKDEAHGSADSPIVIDSDESCSQSSPVGIGIGADKEGRKREGGWREGGREGRREEGGEREGGWERGSERGEGGTHHSLPT